MRAQYSEASTDGNRISETIDKWSAEPESQPDRRSSQVEGRPVALRNAVPPFQVHWQRYRGLLLRSTTRGRDRGRERWVQGARPASRTAVRVTAGGSAPAPCERPRGGGCSGRAWRRCSGVWVRTVFRDTMSSRAMSGPSSSVLSSLSTSSSRSLRYGRFLESRRSPVELRVTYARRQWARW
jgi:hypothetical protein